MDETEKEAMEAYKAEGVELPSEAEPTEPEVKPEEEPKQEEPQEEVKLEEEPKQEEPKEEEEELTPEPQKPKKRSIYQDLKATRQEAKSEKELREQAEKERDEAIEALASAKTPEEKQEAASDLEAFAKEIGADPAALSKMREIFMKDLPKGDLPEGFQDQMQAFQEWQKDNNSAMEKVAFEEEFKQAAPDLKELFPKATAEETETIKAEIEKLAHTDAFHDKEISYIAFKNQKTLSALVSPKKRGLESKGKGDTPEGESFTFDPNADLSKMSPKDQEAWEKEYNKATSSEGLATNELGQKIII